MCITALRLHICYVAVTSWGESLAGSMNFNLIRLRRWVACTVLLICVLLTPLFFISRVGESEAGGGFSLSEGGTPSRPISGIQAPRMPDDARPRPEAPADHGPREEWVRQTLSETWVDDDGKLAERRRIRVVNADFKYPRLRLEETVSVDPATREAGVSLVRASVADHVMVALRDGVKTEVAVAAIRGLGYPVRDAEAGAFLLVEVPDFLEADAQEVAIAALASLEAFIDHAEPDYLVFPCLTPNDPAFLDGKLWGLSNSGTGANSLASADIDAPGGWQIRRTAADVVVAITDTGIHYDHEDLTANMWTHPDHGHFGFNAYDNNFDPIDLGDWNAPDVQERILSSESDIETIEV